MTVKHHKFQKVYKVRKKYLGQGRGLEYVPWTGYELVARYRSITDECFEVQGKEGTLLHSRVEMPKELELLPDTSL